MKTIKYISAGLLSMLSLYACAQTPKKQAKIQKVNMENTQTITLGSGCFWCTEAVYQRLEGVVKVTSGYSGGHVDNPTYEEVCAKTTGHGHQIELLARGPPRLGLH